MMKTRQSERDSRVTLVELEPEAEPKAKKRPAKAESSTSPSKKKIKRELDGEPFQLHPSHALIWMLQWHTLLLSDGENNWTRSNGRERR
jgi:hypothetical protein